MQDFDDVAVEYSDQGTKKFCSTGNGGPVGKEGATKETPCRALGIHVQQASTDRLTSSSWGPDESLDAHRAYRRT